MIVTAGVAEIAAGAIAMGLGGYLAARGDAEHYASERAREQREVKDLAQHEEREVVEIFERYGLTSEACEPILAAFRRDHEAWVDFMMRYELGLEEPRAGRALQSAITIGGAYVVGGLVPLLPYMLLSGVEQALAVSVLATLVALAVFGGIKGRMTGTGGLRGALQTMVVGGLASAVAFAVARLVGA